MKYNDLKNQTYIPEKLNVKNFYSNNVNDGYLFRISLQMAKCENVQVADHFINEFVRNSVNSLFWITKDQSVKQPLGIMLSNFYCDYDKFLSLKYELDSIMHNAEAHNFKGHNAKNLYLKVYIKSNNINKKTKKKIDLFVNLHQQFFRTIARRTKSDRIIYNVEKDYQDFGVNSNRNNNLSRIPVLFNNDTICFQMFRSTMNIGTIYATVQLCKLLVDFCDQQITIDELLLNGNSVENKFNDYIYSKSMYVRKYMEHLKTSMKKENNYLSEQNLTNNLKNCQDINIFDGDRNETESSEWVFHEGQINVEEGNNSNVEILIDDLLFRNALA